MSAVIRPSRAQTGIIPPPITGRNVSSNFCAEDADISFLSIDKIIFKIHSKNLDITCGSFPPSEFKQPEGEEALLTEDSETLEKLFQFVYPRRHPELLDVPFDLLCKIAEAAEKYEVFGAMNICKTRMREKLSQQPLQVFVYGFKHGYDDLMQKTAPLLHEIPCDEVLGAIPDGLVTPWLRYHSSWKSKFLQAFTKDFSQLSNDDGATYGQYLTDQVLGVAMRYLFQKSPEIGSKQAALDALRSAMNLQGYYEEANTNRYGGSRNVDYFKQSMKAFEQALDANLAEVPSFTTYLASLRKGASSV